MFDVYHPPAGDFHDITTGSTGLYKATVGFDQATGRGTLIANLLVNDLIKSEFPTYNAPRKDRRSHAGQETAGRSRAS